MPRPRTAANWKELTAEERRDRRQLRREKQREDNIGRAAKMHAAWLGMEVERPKGPPELKPSVYVGCSGWRYWKWRQRRPSPTVPVNPVGHHSSRRRVTIKQQPYRRNSYYGAAERPCFQCGGVADASGPSNHGAFDHLSIGACGSSWRPRRPDPS